MPLDKSLNELSLKEHDFLITTIVTIALTAVGLIAKYLNDITIVKRKDKLDRVNRQLKEFYGPILSLTSSSKATWTEFTSTWGDRRVYFDPQKPPSQKELETWRNWMLSVFVPINEKIYEIIINNGDLILENEFPKCLKDFCAHVQSYKPVLNKWENKDYSEHISLLNYPNDLDTYIESGYKYLKVKQSTLIK